MKNYKKGILCLAVLAAMPLIAAQDKTIYVNTFADENGENPANCSLREAIQTAKDNKSFGGCTPGNTANGQTDIIQLEAGTYLLTEELKPQSTIRIWGKAPVDFTRKDPITHEYPAFTETKTTISGGGKSRIFNTANSGASVELTHITLTDGYSADYGGAVFAAGPFSVIDGAILNSRAKNGGAVYAFARQTEKEISISGSRLEGNKADQAGSVLAMECGADLMNTQSAITISASSIIRNGSAADPSIMDICGQATVRISSSTIAENTVNPQSGSIIKAISTDGHTLSSSSKMELLSNTIVSNKAFSTLLYDDNGSKALVYNVLAFNTGKSCRYALNGGNVAEITTAGISAVKNAFQIDGVEGACDLPDAQLYDTDTATKEKKFRHIKLNGMSLSDVLTPMLVPNEYNAYLPMYYPVNHSTETDLVDVGGDTCGIDQRGLERVTNGTLTLNPDDKNTCDIGSIENMRLTAADLKSLKNTSYVTLLDYYQAEIDYATQILKYPVENKDLIAAYTEILKENTELLAATKANAKYRAIYLDPFAQALPNAVLSTDSQGNVIAKPEELNTDNYTITAEAIGVGSISGEGKEFKFTGTKDPNMKCEWVPAVKRIMIYRLDDELTGGLGSSYCKYTITSKVGHQTSTGILKADFVNIAPIAKDDSYVIKYGSDLAVSVNPLENDSDDGDGPVSALLNPDKPPFFKGADGKDLAIRIVNQPSSIVIKADRSGPCPTDYIRDTCYGGNLNIQVKNNFSPFSYAIEYDIFDSEGLQSTKTAKIYLNNTSVDSNTKADGGGGGSAGVLGVFGLIGMAAFRTFRRKQK